MYHLNELRTFYAIASTRSLSAAARLRNTPKSTLSRHLAKLEAELGQALFVRESNRMILSEAGRLYHPYATQILELAGEGQEMLDHLRANVEGELRLYVGNGLIRGWLGEVIDSFMQKHSEVRLTLKTHLDDTQDYWRDAIFLWMRDLPHCSLRQECLCTLSQGVYAHEDYLSRAGEPKHPAELVAHDWVDLLTLCSEPVSFESSWGERVVVDPPPSRLQADQLVLQADAIAAGRGLGLMPVWQATLRMEFHPGSFVRCLKDWEGPRIPVWLGYPHGRLTRKHQAFLAHLRNSLPAFWLANGPQLSSPGRQRRATGKNV